MKDEKNVEDKIIELKKQDTRNNALIVISIAILVIIFAIIIYVQVINK